MSASIFNGFYTYGPEELVPFFTRIAVIVIVCAVLWDFFRRRWADAVISAISAADATSSETASLSR